mmetsp:Transcript_18622/g.32610  ORF Transcript_18622/g.32610 Transcript_18622/m.32610 type:complete len:269 (+) Transcript_18622:2455-3261(+)
MMKMKMQMTMARIPIRAPSFSRFFCSGVWFADVSGKPHMFVFLPPSSPAMSCAMRPIRVLIPVSVTMPLPAPLVTLQLEKAMFSGSNFSSPPSFFFFFDVFATSSGSPVSAISLTLKSEASNKRVSAGITSPTPSTTTSPRTTLDTGISVSRPSRITVAFSCCICERASSASPALCSVQAAMPALISTMIAMATPVVYERGSAADGPVAFTATDAQAAQMSKMIMKLVSCMRKSVRRVGFGGFSSSLGPSRLKISSAFALVRPLTKSV